MPQLGENAGKLSHYLARKRYAAARPHLRGRILDFGCANGLLTQWCTPNKYLGVDIDAGSLADARASHPQFTFASEVPAGEKFDSIVALALIEHIKKPAGLLAELKESLTSGGAIVLTTPHPRMEWAHTAGAKVGLFSHEAHDEHEDLIDLKRMEEIAADAGLKVTHYQRFLFGANQLFLLESVD